MTRKFIRLCLALVGACCILAAFGLFGLGAAGIYTELSRGSWRGAAAIAGKALTLSAMPVGVFVAVEYCLRRISAPPAELRGFDVLPPSPPR